MKKVLLALDIGNVCIRIDHQNFARTLGIDAAPEELRQLVLDFECGKFADEKLLLSRAIPMLDNRFSAAEIKNAFNAILIEPMPGMTELAADFDKLQTEAVFFSDISPTHLERTRQLFPSYRYVSAGIFSFESGELKPSAAMFDRFEKLFGMPDIYVDDRVELIEAARKHGWNSMVFAGAEDLREKLISLS